MNIKLVMPPKHTVLACYVEKERAWEIFVICSSEESNLPKKLIRPIFELSGERFRKKVNKIFEELHVQYPEITLKQVEDALKKECAVSNCRPPKYLR